MPKTPIPVIAMKRTSVNKLLFLGAIVIAVATGAVVIIQSGQGTDRKTSYQFHWPARPVEPRGASLSEEGKAEYGEIVGDGEARHIKSILRDLDIKTEGPIPYKRTKNTTTLFIPEMPKCSFTYEQILAGEDRNMETDTRIVVTIDNRTGEILIPADAPVIPEGELDEICRSLLEELKKERHWKLHDTVWMDEVRRVSDWYFVSYRCREEPFRKGESVWFYTFWINARTRKVANDQCGIYYTENLERRSP